MHKSVCCNIYPLIIGCVLLFLQYFDICIASNTHIKSTDVPKFLVGPPSQIYYSPKKLINSRFIPKFDIYILMQPQNVTFQLITTHRDRPENLIYIPTLYEQLTDRFAMSYSQSYAIVHSLDSESGLQRTYLLLHPKLSINYQDNLKIWKIVVYNSMPDMHFYILASTLLGTIRSNEIQTRSIELPEFSPMSDETVTFLIGNTGRILCYLPKSTPSPPTVIFYLNDVRLDLSQSDHYQLIYLGGDDSGKSWEERLIHSIWEPVNNYQQSSIAILLINQLRQSDSGTYSCRAGFFDQTVTSKQNTKLIVTKPNEMVNTNLRYTSSDQELAMFYNITNSNRQSINNAVNNNQIDELNFNTINLLANEGQNLTLFCIFESAPIVATRWYHETQVRNVEINHKFGILMIASVQMGNEGVYTCRTESPFLKPIGRSFYVTVKKKAIPYSTTNEILHHKLQATVMLSCTDQIKQLIKSSVDVDFSLYGANTHDFNKSFQFRNGLNASRTERTDSNYEIFNDTSFKIKWFHNGQVLKRSLYSNKYYFKGGMLKFNLASKSDAGIYQCQLKLRQQSILPVNFLVLLDNTEQYETDQHQTHSKDDTIQEYTTEGLTGHLNCNISTVLKVDKEYLQDSTNQYKWSILWYRGLNAREILNIEASNKASGGIKYIVSSVNEFNQILSIVNPKRSLDDGYYICRVYNTTTGQMVGEKRFQLVIQNEEQNKEKSNMKLTQLPTQSSTNSVNKIRMNKPNNIKPEQSSNSDLINKFSKFEAQHIPSIQNELTKFRIDRPIVRRLTPFLLLVHIKWHITGMVIENLFYQIEIVELSADILDQQIELDQINYKLSNKIKLNPMIFKRNHAVIGKLDTFRPGNVYCVRVRVWKNSTYLLPIGVKQHSLWSKPFSFENVLQILPEIVSLVPQNTTCLNLTWMISGKNVFIPTAKKLEERLYKFVIIYRKRHNILIKEKGLWDDWQDLRNNAIISNSYGIANFPDLKTISIEGNYTVTNHVINGLEPNTVYDVSLFIEFIDDQNGQQKSYFTLPATEFEVKTLSEARQSIKYLPFDPVTSTESRKNNNVDMKLIQNKQWKHVLSTNSTNLYDREGYVLIVLLGSLTGILFIIFIAISAFCIWYRIHIKGQITRANIGYNEVANQRHLNEYDKSPTQTIFHTDCSQKTFPNNNNFQIQSFNMEQNNNYQLDVNNFSTLQYPPKWIQPNLNNDALTGANHHNNLNCHTNRNINNNINNNSNMNNNNNNNNNGKNKFITYWAKEENIELSNSMENKLPNHLHLSSTMHMGTNKKNPMNQQNKNEFYCLTNNIFMDNGINHNNNNNNNIKNLESENDQLNCINSLYPINAEDIFREFQPINDQSSSVYSHIDSDSTVNELSLWNLDKSNPAINTTTTTTIEPERIHQLTGLLGQSNKQTNLEPILSTSASHSPTDYGLPIIWNSYQSQLPVNSGGYCVPFSLNPSTYTSTNNVDKNLQNLFQLQLLNYKQNKLLMSAVNSTNDPSKYISAVNLQNWLTNMNKYQANESRLFNYHLNNNGMIPNEFITNCATQNRSTTTTTKPKLVKYPKEYNQNLIDNDFLNKTDEKQILNLNKHLVITPRENLSSSFADSGVDLPINGNMEQENSESNALTTDLKSVLNSHNRDKHCPETVSF